MIDIRRLGFGRLGSAQEIAYCYHGRLPVGLNRVLRVTDTESNQWHGRVKLLGIPAIPHWSYALQRGAMVKRGVSDGSDVFSA